MAANDRQVAFRLPSELVARIDQRAEIWSRRVPGMRVTRADVVRTLLVDALRGHAAKTPRDKHPASVPYFDFDSVPLIRMDED